MRSVACDTLCELTRSFFCSGLSVQNPNANRSRDANEMVKGILQKAVE